MVISPTAPPVRAANPLLALAKLGQSAWLDFIRKDLLDSGELARLVAEDGLKGVTSNPAIFEKAIAGSKDYEADLALRRLECGRDPKAVYEELAVADIQRAADLLAGVYKASRRVDGYVSLEVSPHLARDTKATLAEARRLWKAVDRPNLMIKVPATKQGLPAIQRLIAEGINVNVTLLFSVESYLAVARAHMAGLAERAQKKHDVSKVASVASFFISRIDSAVDEALEKAAQEDKSPGLRDLALSLRGKAAIACAKLAYAEYEKLLSGKAWRKLARRRAMPQRLLWASTSTKNPAYADVLYAEGLIGPETVNTLPPQTLAAFRDHGRARVTLTAGVAEARASLREIEHCGVVLEKVSERLLEQGVVLFQESFDKLLEAVKRQALVPSGGNARLAAQLPPELAAAVDAGLEEWRTGGKLARLWNGDATLWTGADESKWLGWLGIVDQQLAEIGKFEKLAREMRESRFKHCLLLGMGGSSLCPEVLKYTFGKQKGYPELLVLDSTDPQQIRAFEKRIDYDSTLFVVASKSGSTLEPNIFKAYFHARAKEELGTYRAGSQFIAITDPGSQMQRVALEDGFGRIFFGLKSIGGRYSALSDFGMVPAALCGLDVRGLLERAAEMSRACGPAVDPRDNPGARLGLILGTAAKQGRDKVTLVASSSVQRLGAWLEQLIAESTGKLGRALIPLEAEALGSPKHYGTDRVFVYLSVRGDDDSAQAKALQKLEQAGHPVVRIELRDTLDLAAEFFRWEIATAVAGAVIGINPFDQPDVEASKIATKQLTAACEETGSLPAEKPLWSGEGVELYTDGANAAALSAALGGKSRPKLADWLRAHFGRVAPGDYVALLAYLDMNPAHERELAALRHTLRDEKRAATCLGFGPRFLHSTGQAYKGGPNTGVVLQITCDDAKDLDVPGSKLSFGVVKAAQARGDFAVLAERGRRALRVHLGPDVKRGLKTLRAATQKALR
ncbi:MAG: bifunctional transaldolase/phosoglucose isomerase [Planctomycetes bacterium]|nr:bifunctional transaldolase/phosoglucose isomerase [Planctomycetota bacterium]